MKKSIFSLLGTVATTVLGFGLTGCNEGSELMPPDRYKLLSSSSSTITVESYLAEGMSDKYTLPKLGVTPSGWLGSSFLSLIGHHGSCTISNGQKTITHRSQDRDPLFEQDSYILFDTGDQGEKTYLFVITDDFFKDGIDDATAIESTP